jgi:hypothetical protein
MIDDSDRTSILDSEVLDALLVDLKPVEPPPERALPEPSEVSDRITLEFPAEGGHVGFCTGPFPGRVDWLPHRLLEFLAATLPPRLP